MSGRSQDGPVISPSPTRDRVSLCSLGLELRELLVSASGVLALKVYDTTAQFILHFLKCVCTSDCVYTEYRCLQRPEEGVRYQGAGVTGSCEQPHVGAGKQTQVL